MSENKNSGYIAGVTRAVLSQPFDTIKTKMQVNSNYYKTSLNCLRMTIKTDGIRGLYTGLPFPLIGNIFIVGTHFNVYNRMDNPLIGGAIAGLMGSFISNPVEYIRIKMQLANQHDNHKHYSSSWDCVRTIVKKNGFSGLFRGQTITSLRETIGYTGFFSVYHYFPKSDEYPYLFKILKGIGCGMALWGTMYPIDVIKTHIQGNRLENSPLTVSGAFHTIFKSNGFRGFYKGFGLTMFRAVPVNVGIVATVDFYNQLDFTLREI